VKRRINVVGDVFYGSYDVYALSYLIYVSFHLLVGRALPSKVGR
jgi:hypothetical protein